MRTPTSGTVFGIPDKFSSSLPQHTSNSEFDQREVFAALLVVFVLMTTGN